MGQVPSKKKPVINAEELPRLFPEPQYDVKTRSPMPSTWSLNIMRGKREDELRNECYSTVRRKCFDYVKDLQKCSKENGTFWTVFNCQEENFLMGTCFDHEFNIEMDRKRRDMERNPDWWWRDLYDEKGEIGNQAEWDGSWFLTMQIKEFLGISTKKPWARKDNKENVST